MFTDHKKTVMTEWSKNTKIDFEAVLEVFDTNKDKIFNNADDKFSDFYVWQDKNSNGAVEGGELKSLKEHGIKSSTDEFHLCQPVFLHDVLFQTKQLQQFFEILTLEAIFKKNNCSKFLFLPGQWNLEV